MTTQSPTVLVTGSGGFTGVPMRRELESCGYRVVGTTLDNPGPDDRLLDIESPASCDALVADVMPDYVVHLAGISFVPQANPLKLYAANVVGTTNLLDALVSANARPKKVILASSANVYGNREGIRITETDVPQPTSHYAASKLAMEVLAATYFEKLPIIVTRPFNYTGPGQSVSFLVPKIVSHFARQEPFITLGNIDVERDFSDVATVVRIYRKLLESPARSVTTNICSGTATSLQAVLSLMREIAGYQIEVRTDASLIRPNEIKRLAGDPSSLLRIIGPIDAVPLRETLQRMYESMRSSAPS